MAPIVSNTELTFPGSVPIWGRQPRETHRAYMAFCAYRDLGPVRSLRKAALAFYGGTELPRKWDKSGVIPTQVERWSSRHRWVARATAWDAYVDQERRAAHIQAVREMEIRHVQTALRVQVKGLEALELLDLSKFKPADVIRFLVEGVKLERLARGVVTGSEESISEPAVSVTVTPWAATDPRQRLMEHLVDLAKQELVREQSLARIIEVDAISVAPNGNEPP